MEYLRTRHAKDGEDGTCSTTAFYLRDEVSGPLSGAEGKEDVEEGDRTMKEELMTPSEQDVR